MLFTAQVIGCLYAWIHIALLFCRKNRFAASTSSGIIFKMVLVGLLTRWTTLVVDVIQTDQSLTSEWNPYALLHIEDDGSFNTKEIREAYRRLSKKYHPDKVNWSKF